MDLRVNRILVIMAKSVPVHDIKAPTNGSPCCFCVDPNVNDPNCDLEPSLLGEKSQSSTPILASIYSSFHFWHKTERNDYQTSRILRKNSSLTM